MTTNNKSRRWSYKKMTTLFGICATTNTLAVFANAFVGHPINVVCTIIAISSALQAGYYYGLANPKPEPSE